VQQRGRDAAIGTWRRQLQLLIGEARADVKQLEVCPFVVPEGFEPRVSHVEVKF